MIVHLLYNYQLNNDSPSPLQLSAKQCPLCFSTISIMPSDVFSQLLATITGTISWITVFWGAWDTFLTSTKQEYNLIFYQTDYNSTECEWKCLSSSVHLINKCFFRLQMRVNALLDNTHGNSSYFIREHSIRTSYLYKGYHEVNILIYLKLICCITNMSS